MKKTIRISFLLIFIITVCIHCFLSTGNKVQAVLFSPATALQSNSIFSMRNCKTNQIYILQTNKKDSAISLYRYIADGVMKKYVISGTLAQTFNADHAEWIRENSISLPADPYAVIKELRNLYNGKSDKTHTIKVCSDALLSFVASADHDSSHLFDYAAFPAVFEKLKSLLHEKQTRSAIAFHVLERGFLTTYECSPFRQEDFRRQLASLFSELFCVDQRKLFCSAFEDLFINLQTCTLRIQQNLGGQFQSLFIYNEGNCVFSIEKFK